MTSNLSQRANNQQRKASDPTKSVWVNASAGTGKTKVLSDRVLRLLLKGVNPSKILCLTYTKAAAVEMNARVAKRLSDWAVATETELEKELLNLFGELPEDIKSLQDLKANARQLFATMLDTPGGIKIQTIHSFAQEVLKRFPLEAQISPYFEVMDDRDVAEVIKQIKKHLVNSPHLEIFTHAFNEFKFPEVVNSIINNRSKINRILNNDLLKKLAERLEINPEDIVPQFVPHAEDLKILLKAWLESGTRLQNRASLLADVLENFESEKFIRVFLDSENKPYKTIASKALLDANPKLTEIYAKQTAKAGELVQKLKSLSVFQSTKAVVLLAEELLKSYDRYKKTHAKIDYNDMILLTRRLLEDKSVAEWVLFKLDGGIDNILIDEAQDTSPDQWAIIRSLSEEFFASNTKRTVFAVGDRKQSIYSFQGADPDKFDEMREHFSQKSTDFEKINLEVSFRSTPAILDMVNFLFADENIKQGVVSAEEDITHLAFRENDAGSVELWEILEPEEGENTSEWLPPVEHKQTPSTSSRMARQIALRIKQTVNNQETLPSQNRPIQYGDFLILVRSRDAFAEELIRECKASDVPVAGIDRLKLLEQIAIKDLISLGKFLLLPEDDLSLAEALKSPIFGLDDDNLLELCPERKGSLWEALKANPKYQNTTLYLKALLNMTDFVRPFELYNYVLSVMKARQKFSARMGLEAEDGLDEFMNLALSFEQSHIPTLQRFIEWIEADDIEIKRELEQGQSNVVRLMTVHGSKGLQAPIVILPDTTRVPQCKKEAEILFEDDIFFYPNSAEAYNLVCENIKEKQKQKMMEEYRRLMYVALTRAEDRLIVCGFRKSRQPAEESWYNLLKNSFSKIATLDEPSNIWHYKSEQRTETKPKEIQTKTPVIPESGDWIDVPAQPESPLNKPLTPSKPDEPEPAALSPLVNSNEAKFYKRGLIIHKLLQFMPQADTAKVFVKNQAPEMPDTEVEIIVNEVTDLLNNPQFGSLFGKNSKAEVPIMGMTGGKIISGQIDRLVVEKDRVLVVDFKTNRPAAANEASVPEVYRKQMRAYRELLAQIYPDKKVVTLILWTNTANLMEII